MTKRLSPERLEEIRYKVKTLPKCFKLEDMATVMHLNAMLLAHIDALEEELNDTRKLLNIAHHNWRMRGENKQP